MKSSSIAKARGSITNNFHVPLENLRSDPRRTMPFVPGTERRARVGGVAAVARSELADAVGAVVGAHGLAQPAMA